MHIPTITTLPQHRHGIYSTFQNIIKTEGIFGLYQGLGASLLVAVPQLAISFSVYGTIKDRLLAMHGPSMFSTRTTFLSERDTHLLESVGRPAAAATISLTPVGSMTAGAVSGVLSSLVVFPFDVVRRRMQVMQCQMLRSVEI